MEIRRVVVFFVCVTFAQLSSQTQPVCLNVMMKNSSDTAVEGSFFTLLEQFIEENKIIEPISAYLNTGRLDVTVSFWIAYADSKVKVKLCLLYTSRCV